MQFILERGASAASLSAADVVAHQQGSSSMALPRLAESDLRLATATIDHGK
jgi:hypothetical protein